LAVTLKQPSDKSGPSNDHHSSEQVFESKQARRSVSPKGSDGDAPASARSLARNNTVRIKI
jgi:hypothetical protein